MHTFGSLLSSSKRLASAGGHCLYLFTVGLLHPVSRFRAKQVCHFLGHFDRKALLPSVGISKLVGPDVPVTVRAVSQSNWNVNAFELAVLNALVVHFKPHRIFEIGTFDGRTTLNLAANTSPDALVYTLDLPPGTVNLPGGVQSGERFRGTDVEGRIRPLYGNSFDFDFSPYAGSIDLVFVDAGHAYENVANDSKVAMQLVGNRPGVIVWHDYETIAGVTQAVDELIPTRSKDERFFRIEGTSLACLVRS